MRAGPPRSANDTQPSLHGQISRCTLVVCRKKAPARWPRLPVIFDHRRGRHVRHHHRLLQRDVDVLALAGALAREQRERDAGRRLDAAVVVRHRHRAAHRRAIGIAGAVQVAAHGERP